MGLVADAAGKATAKLNELAVAHALVGGLAVSARTEPRFTQDVDLAIAVEDDAAAEAIVQEFARSGFTISAIVEQRALDRLSTVRLRVTGEEQLLDLLFASSGIEPEIAADAEILQILPGLRLPVARVGHLIALKLLARDDETRPQDAADLAALVATAGPDEIQRAADAVELIEQRGYNRGRDLRKALAELLGT